MVESHEPLLLTTTTGDRGLAERIGTELIDRRLAACVQIDGLLTSLFRWEGEITSEDEFRLSIKTSARHLLAIEQLLDDLHSYDVPELIAVPIVGGGKRYLEWLEAETC
jgi:periplasmic divalent cation tolerance protein